VVGPKLKAILYLKYKISKLSIRKPPKTKSTSLTFFFLIQKKREKNPQIPTQNQIHFFLYFFFKILKTPPQPKSIPFFSQFKKNLKKNKTQKKKNSLLLLHKKKTFKSILKRTPKPKPIPFF